MPEQDSNPRSLTFQAGRFNHCIRAPALCYLVVAVFWNIIPVGIMGTNLASHTMIQHWTDSALPPWHVIRPHDPSSCSSQPVSETIKLIYGATEKPATSHGCAVQTITGKSRRKERPSIIPVCHMPHGQFADDYYQIQRLRRGLQRATELIPRTVIGSRPVIKRIAGSRGARNRRITMWQSYYGSNPRSPVRRRLRHPVTEAQQTRHVWTMMF